MDQNPYESPENYNAAPISFAPMDFRPWRLFLAIHLVLVIATLIATLIDMGYWGRLNEPDEPVFQYLFGGLMLVVTLGILIPFCVSPIVVFLLFTRAFTQDKRYALAGLVELFLAGTQLFVAMPMCQ